MKKYKYNIINLDCANCAREIEEELNKSKQFKNVVVNFSTSKISYESECEISLKELNKFVKKIENDATVVEEKDVRQNKEYHLSILIIGTLFGIFGVSKKLPFYLNDLLVFLSYLMLIYRPLINAISTLIKNRTINENALITISCIGAYLIGETMEGIMVLFLYILGKILEEKAINNTRRSIKNLLDIKQDYANKKEKSDLVRINVEEIQIGDILIVKKGEKIPVDCVIKNGNTKLDTSALTGESELLIVNKGDELLSGSINTDDVIEIIATSLFKDSTVSKILELVEDATDKKANTETFVAKASKIYTPLVILAALLVVILLPIFTNIGYSESIYRALTFLVISCPCAIAISVPLSYFTGIGVSSKNGILIKGSNFLDGARNIKEIVFDKTGTITTGSFEVTNIESFDENYTVENIIEIIVKGESFSNHPIAKSIMKLSTKKINTKDVENYKEIAGEGISFSIDNKRIKIGTIKTCECEENTDLHLNINGKHIASITINDGIKSSALNTINHLKKLGIKTHMFTGDKKDVALEIGKKLGIDEIKYEMLPTDKYSAYETISTKDNFVAFIGDGINDAPVLKRADIGISMGGVGSSAAIEASDIVIMNDDLSKITKAISISKYTNNIIKQNLIFAITVKLAILLLSVFGIATMWLAVFADTGVTLLTILNTLRIIKKYK